MICNQVGAKPFKRCESKAVKVKVEAKAKAKVKKRVPLDTLT
jgi:hypothetical protein